MYILSTYSPAFRSMALILPFPDGVSRTVNGVRGVSRRAGDFGNAKHPHQRRDKWGCLCISVFCFCRWFLFFGLHPKVRNTINRFCVGASLSAKYNTNKCQAQFRCQSSSTCMKAPAFCIGPARPGKSTAGNVCS